MAFRVAGAIGAVAVELILGLLQDLRARFARAFAAVAVEKDEEGLEPERGFEPAKRRLRILIAHGA